MQRILITSALPYANGSLHFGHIAGAYLPADCYARFERLRGNEVLYVCGSDEYGVAITLSAELAGRTPQEQSERFHELNQAFFRALNIRFDHFSRTTAPKHAPLVQQFFSELSENGYIELRETEQLYSEVDSRFLADRYVVGTCPSCGFEEARGDECLKCGASYEATDLKSPRSKMTGAPVVRKKTRHWFLLFEKFKDQLDSFIAARPWKANVTRFARSYVEEIHARAITRDLEWGVPVPLREADGKVFYVWFDAPIGYISATQEWAEQKGDAQAWKSYWCDPGTKYVQFIGKDNIPFHAIFFPAMIMGQNQPYKCVDDLVANEFYNLEGRQFSKSEGWILDIEGFFERFHADQIRYAIAANAPETSDSEFTWKDFQSRCNTELLGKFGNLVNRVLVFTQNNCAGKVPSQHTLEESDHRFINEMARLALEISESYATYRLRLASQKIMELAQTANTYFDAKRPWKDAKEEKTRPTMETTLALCLDCIKVLACAAFPIMPQTAEKIWSLLGFEAPLESFQWDQIMEMSIEAGRPLPKPFILFQKVEDQMIEQEIEKLNQTHIQATEVKEPPYAPLKEEIVIDDFFKVDLRVGLITAAEKLPKSKKLLKLQVDLGFETRTLLSGISQHYTPEELVGKKVIVVANLKPATIMGVESQGMVLAGCLDTALEVVTLKDLPAGAEIS
ncbi:MAG: Methionine--tRNA ligase [Chlamydiales bacterium]|nr:Methionine--tRNA ligase [Chlamydiales bacterium]